jgi:hypothetical protein
MMMNDYRGEPKFEIKIVSGNFAGKKVGKNGYPCCIGNPVARYDDLSEAQESVEYLVADYCIWRYPEDSLTIVEE